MNRFYKIGAVTLLLVLLSVAIVACSGSSSAEAVTSDAANGRAGQNDVDRAHRKGRTKPPTCTHADVTASSESGAIDFKVNCVTTSSGGEVGFSLGRYSLRGRRNKQGILALRRHPLIGGPGAASKSHGQCRRLAPGSWVKDGVRCSARGRGRIVISGRIWVKPRWRCSMGVSVIVAERARCGKEFCLADEEFKVLAEGRPRGC